MSARDRAEKIARKLPKVESQSAPIETPPDPTGETLRVQIARIVHDERKDAARALLAGRLAAGWLLRHGAAFVEATSRTRENIYWLDSRYNPSVLRRLHSEECQALLAARCGRNSGENFWKLISGQIDTILLDPDDCKARRVVMETAWAQRGKAEERIVYLSCGAMLVRVTSEKVALVPNGTDDVFIPEEQSLPGWELVPEVDSVDPSELLFLKSAHLPARQKLLFGLSIIALPLSGNGIEHVSVPPDILEGPSQSGKTTCQREKGRLFWGPSFTETDPLGEDASKAYRRTLYQNRYVVWDNLDNPSRIKWFPDSLASSVTGSKSAEKTLYLNRGVTDLPVRSVQSLSTINADFLIKHPTLATRCLLYQWTSERNEFDTDSVERDTQDKRNHVLSFICYALSRAIRQPPSQKRISFRFDRWARNVFAIARPYGIEDEAEIALEEVRNSVNARSVSANIYGRALLAHLRVGGDVSGTAGQIFEQLSITEGSSMALSGWLRNCKAVVRGILEVTEKWDPHARQNSYKIARIS